MNCKNNCLNILILTVLLLTFCEARGGRRGGGGSFGGLFGSWRKYKKPSSGSVSSRRTGSSSSPPEALNENKKYTGNYKFQKTNNYYNNYHKRPLAVGESSYRNTDIFSGNQIESLIDYLTERLIITHIAPPDYNIVQRYTDYLRNDDNTDNFLSIVKSIFDKSVATTVESSYSESPETTTVTSITSDTTGTTEIQSTKTELPFSTTETPIPSSYGTICMPMSMQEINEEGKQVQVEKTVCYPASAPTSPLKNDLQSKKVEIAGDIIEP